MGLMRRLSLVFKSKASKVLDRAEDPRETLDYSYQRQLQMLQQVKRGVADVATSRKRVELQAGQLQDKAAKLHDQAKRAVEAGRDDLATEALSRRAAIQPELEELRRQHEQLQGEEAKLTQAAGRLQVKVDAFRTRKETIKATYTAAEAQARIGEALSGIGEEMGDVGLAIQRAEDKTAAMQSRAGAVDELLASGALDDLTGGTDPIEAELSRVAMTSGVDEELAALKGELGKGDEAKPLAAGDASAAPAQPEPKATPQDRSAT